MIEIKETGSYFKVDEEGYLINPASVEKIQDEWRDVVEELVELYKKYFGDSLVSVYLRGSVSKGEAIEGISDVDSFAYVDMPPKDIDTKPLRKDVLGLENRYDFVDKIEVSVDHVDMADNRQFWLAQSVVLFGKDLQTERFKVGKDCIRHARKPENLTKSLAGFLAREDSDENRAIRCAWLSKQILRSVIELCFERSGKYSRDLYRCWETFSEYYPDKSDEMKEVLHLALNPIADEEKIIALGKKWVDWIVEEKKNLGY